MYRQHAPPGEDESAVPVLCGHALGWNGGLVGLAPLPGWPAAPRRYLMEIPAARDPFPTQLALNPSKCNEELWRHGSCNRSADHTVHAEVDLKTEKGLSERNTDNSGAHDSVVPVNALACRRDSSRNPKLNFNSHDGVVRSAIIGIPLRPPV